MNRLPGHIVSVKEHGALSAVTVNVGHEVLIQAIVIETSETAAYLQSGKEIIALFKETAVTLDTGTAETNSAQNRITAAVAQIEKGVLLTNVRLRSIVGEIDAVLPTESIERLAITRGAQVTVLIMSNEIMLAET